MKRIFRKNQVIIGALAVMIAVAGYLNYSGRIFGSSDDAAQTSGELANKELLDISEDDLTETSGDIVSQDSEAADGTVEGTPGEAVLTSGDASAVVAEAKVTREQVRAKNKESLMEIIDNENLSDAQKEDAVNQMIAMTDLAEKEAAAETLLSSKGFSETVVSLTADSADVVVNASELSDANRAQIEDIISRKTGIAAENIVITPVYAEEK
ncbi:SpoIIIAH-like family protein [Dorea acetigenes]|uniref:SpoIIIAH-like family protein n=1 Tax=Dorea acetigenes TaxID=2981787 RepID=A0ABT2RPY6_9FIRM|nr:SpoIIIAH-like family protein [Dorea acetigenes]MCB6413647.1 SpoIIIAH-like family protein [Faecalimonas umbilicata]MCU6687488.1 SpoIIIAH-like family protein [Dorea acetigenes]SCJ44012.1 SpoIIIAH-like protein [uncultured Clostridium sp.]